MSTDPLTGGDAASHLENNGFPAHTPLIRSSDEGIIATCPFGYYLKRRLGLVSVWRDSRALCRGSWFHTVFEHYALAPTERREAIAQTIERRLSELRDTIEEFPEIGPERRTAILDAERRYAREAIAHFECAADVCVPGSRRLNTGFLDYLNSARWENLAQECLIVHTSPKAPRVPRVAQPDLILYDRKNNHIWLVDVKTTSLSRTDYANTLRFEFQTQHYLHVAHDAAEAGLFASTFGLPVSAKVAGMQHLLIAMPDISLGNKDRPYHWHSDGKKTRRQGTARQVSPKEWQYEVIHSVDGDVKDSGSCENEEDVVKALHEACGKAPSKVIHHESPPSLDAYQNRLAQWMNGTGEYLHKAEERAADPGVNLAITYTSSVLDDRATSDYHASLHTIHDYATRDPHPENFPRRARGAVDSLTRRETPYSGFYYNDDIREWPKIARREQLMTRQRDTNISIHTPDTIITQETP